MEPLLINNHEGSKRLEHGDLLNPRLSRLDGAPQLFDVHDRARFWVRQNVEIHLDVFRRRGHQLAEA